MITLNAHTVFQSVLADAMRLDQYAYIMNTFRNTDVTTDSVYQKTFNAFYVVRCDENWRREYYALMEQCKTAPHTFEEILKAMHSFSGRVEASYASKLLATIDSSYPIWDQYVLKNLGVKDRKGFRTIEGTVDAYEQIRGWYADYLGTDEAKENIGIFDRELPDYAWISDLKKIDFMLWKMR